ncbi:hypothetical protein [Kordia sp.]|uniref:hypothetical protein n=1 Tax=Kordia sp. TaxID=1965332 RepID=UPI003D6BE780
MKTPRNPLIGYTYQQQITFLFLIMMDAKRNFNSLEMEAEVNHNFDDLKISCDDGVFYFQIKDFKDIKLKNLTFLKNQVSIKGKIHKLSTQGVNIIFFKNIELNTNSSIFGLDSFLTNNIHIISLSRLELDEIIDDLYGQNNERRLVIEKFFKQSLDDRKLLIERRDLPVIKVYDTKLIEETINVGKEHLEFSNILFIEGKPGIGKSHYVDSLAEIYEENILYRFWISNQDKDYRNRLLYDKFLSDISKKIYRDYTSRDENEIINKIKEKGKLIIIDGLDHVENYNKTDLTKFISFINLLCKKCKVIVLSRPLKTNITWKKQILTNWNKKQTIKVVKELYHIENYRIGNRIFELTDGYPILVRFICEHYKKNDEIPDLKKLTGIDDYYNQVLENVETKTALTLFLTSRSFFMKSELKLFLKDELFDLAKEFIKAYPYLFEIRLNRISLFHDSFNKYLRELNINFLNRKEKVNEIVYYSILNQEAKFISRYSYFDLDNKMKLDIIKKFCSIKVFKEIATKCIDYEALRSFYNQIRETLSYVSCNDLSVQSYYDLSLILNTVIRDHVSTNNQFLYTYVKSLLFNGFTIKDITSSGYLFGTFYYIMEQDFTFLYNLKSNDHYGTSRFLEELRKHIDKENSFFEIHENPLKLNEPIGHYLDSKNLHLTQNLIAILTNLYIYKTSEESLLELQKCIVEFIDGDELEGINQLRIILKKRSLNTNLYHPKSILNKIKRELFALGKLKNVNPYLHNSLKAYIQENNHIGSFEMWVNVLNYLRLSLKEKRKIDITDIGHFWYMYHERKDYTIINIYDAYKVFEENELIKEKQSIKNIVFAQSISEKGIQYILRDYINDHSPKILEKIETHFDLDDLQVIWFDLSTKHINAFSDNLFEHALSEFLYNHQYSRKIEFKDIKNVFASSKWVDLLKILKFVKHDIRIPNDAPELNELEKHDIVICPYDTEDDYSPMSSNERYNDMILDSKDKDFILEKKLSILEISKCLDGNYSSLTDLEIYKLYSKDVVSKNLNEILYNAMTAKTLRTNSFGNLFHFVGNLPRIVNDYHENSNIEKLFESFNIFLELSLLNENKYSN